MPGKCIIRAFPGQKKLFSGYFGATKSLIWDKGPKRAFFGHFLEILRVPTEWERNGLNSNMVGGIWSPKILIYINFLRTIYQPAAALQQKIRFFFSKILAPKAIQAPESSSERIGSEF